MLVLVALRTGIHRFGDLRRNLEGVSEKMLSRTLQALEADGFVQRIAYPVVPPHVEYDLTPLDRDVATHAHALVDWIESNIGTILSDCTAPLDVLQQRLQPRQVADTPAAAAAAPATRSRGSGARQSSL
ncbi:winged helix-turn-helix transcriptional regulator [Xanthomonas theicola]|uniref:winged helix-turn-helix transcriptional regulator n=1 Tax=Xanthomonas theicola TaxID=56464 RepID=UPI00248426A1|nr:winged helix-turn-helix transcriptional regulator [Xanthomonas theicola]